MSEAPSSLPRLFAELKRRRVFRVMAVYGIVGFVVLQVVDLAVPALLLPEWTYRLVALIILIGFPIAIMLAWAFEPTPDGVRRTADAAPEEIAEILAQPASRRWSAGLLALAGVALLFGAWWMGRQGSPSADLKLAAPRAEAASFPRIAVLPFEDLGGNDELPVLVTGMHMEVQNKLAQLAQLRVISTASVSAYEGTDKSPRQIAAELGNVDHLLQGSVRRSDDQARVDVRLIDVATNENVWFEQWEPDVTAENLFAIQSEIALAIANQLEAELTPGEIEVLEAGQSTDNLEAINYYYRALNALSLDEREETWRDALTHTERAVELAPEYVEAWELLAWLRSVAIRFGVSPDARALEAVERAEALAPGSRWALEARANYVWAMERDPAKVLGLLQEAARKAPSDAGLLWGISSMEYRLGEFDQALRTLKKAVALDPRNLSWTGHLARLLGSLGRWHASMVVVERMLAIDPASVVAKMWLVSHTNFIHRDPGRAQRVAAELGVDPTDPYVAAFLAWNALERRDYEEAADLIRHLDQNNPISLAYRLGRAWEAEVLRGGNAVPIRDSLIALVDMVPAISANFKFLAAVARFLASDEDAGLTLLREHEEDARSSGDVARPAIAAVEAAYVYALFGHTDEAISALGRGIARPSDPGSMFGLASLEQWPVWDSLRDEPRFADILSRQAAYEQEQARIAEAEGPWLP